MEQKIRLVLNGKNTRSQGSCHFKDIDISLPPAIGDYGNCILTYLEGARLEKVELRLPLLSHGLKSTRGVTNMPVCQVNPS